MTFEITILGSGAALPTLRRNTSSQYVNCNERHILIDCGEGTQNQIRKFAIKFQKIKHILISHLHGDHFFGLIGLISTMNLLGRSENITIYGPKELKEIIELQMKASGHAINFGLKFVELQFQKPSLIFQDKKIEIWSIPMKHRIPTNGFVIKEKTKEFPINGEELKKDKLSIASIPFFRRGEDFIDEDAKVFKYRDYTFSRPESRSYAYFSDTAIVNKNANFIKDFTCLYHEATFTNEHHSRAKSTYHSTSLQVGEFAKLAAVKQLIMGHLSSRYDNADIHLKEAKLNFENSIVAEDGLKIKL
jgi:ribonuclease Z